MQKKKILIVDNHLNSCNACYSFRREIHSNYRVVTRTHKDLPKTFSHYSHIVLTGGTGRIDTGDPAFVKLQTFIRHAAKSGIPMLGICFGCQAIAVSLGSETFLTNFDKPAIGWNRIYRIGESRLLNGLPKQFYCYEHHHSHVNRLPAGFIHTAHSRRTKFEAFEHNSLPIFGIQFHPDISHRRGRQLYNEQIKERMPKRWLIFHKLGRPPYSKEINKKIFYNFYHTSK